MVLIEISINVARWMKELATQLFQEGYSTNWTPEDAENAVYDLGGFVDTIPRDNLPAREWIHATMSLLRCLAAILAQQLEEEDSLGQLSLTYGDDEV